MNPEKKKMTRAEAGRKGAYGLNSNPELKAYAAKKAAQTRKKKDPDVYVKMGRLGAKMRDKNRRLNDK